MHENPKRSEDHVLTGVRSVADSVSVRELVAAGADKTKVNMAGDTPAMLAARYKFEGVIDALK